MINTTEWTKNWHKKDLPDITKIITEYFITSGQAHLAEIYMAETNQPNNIDEEAKSRQKLRQLILQGEIDQAIQYLDEFDLHDLDSNSDLNFMVICHKAAELIHRSSNNRCYEGKCNLGMYKQDNKKMRKNNLENDENTLEPKKLTDLDMNVKKEEYLQPNYFCFANRMCKRGDVVVLNILKDTGYTIKDYDEENAEKQSLTTQEILLFIEKELSELASKHEHRMGILQDLLAYLIFGHGPCIYERRLVLANLLNMRIVNRVSDVERIVMGIIKREESLMESIGCPSFEEFLIGEKWVESEEKELGK